MRSLSSIYLNSVRESDWPPANGVDEYVDVTGKFAVFSKLQVVMSISVEEDESTPSISFDVETMQFSGGIRRIGLSSTFDILYKKGGTIPINTKATHTSHGYCIAALPP